VGAKIENGVVAMTHAIHQIAKEKCTEKISTPDGHFLRSPVSRGKVTSGSSPLPV